MTLGRSVWSRRVAPQNAHQVYRKPLVAPSTGLALLGVESSSGARRAASAQRFDRVMCFEGRPLSWLGKVPRSAPSTRRSRRRRPARPRPIAPSPAHPVPRAAVTGGSGARAQARRRSSSPPTPLSVPPRPAWLTRRAQHAPRGQRAAPRPPCIVSGQTGAGANGALSAPGALPRRGRRFCVG